jgi:hypothetical protein
MKTTAKLGGASFNIFFHDLYLLRAFQLSPELKRMPLFSLPEMFTIVNNWTCVQYREACAASRPVYTQELHLDLAGQQELALCFENNFLCLPHCFQTKKIKN